MDETMSQDTAFSTDNNNDETFTFDVEEGTSPDSQTNEENEETNDSPDNSVEEPESNQKVPYNRFKKVVEERNESAERIAFLEGQLQAQQEARATKKESSPEDVDMPSEWVELYGDSDASKRAWAIQQRREESLQEKAIEAAIERIQNREIEEQEAVAENENIIDESLEDLQATIGKKLTPKQEEDILTIVDEFSPTGRDGKYITLFPFEKAYEIYSLRQSQKGLGTQRARQSVVDLTNNTSEGEADSETSFKRGWDTWRDAL